MRGLFARKQGRLRGGLVTGIAALSVCAATALAAHPTARPLTTPDPTFGGDGFTPTAVPGNGAEAFAVQRYPDGRIAVAGTNHEPTGDRVFIARYTATGAPDDTFDEDGVLVTDLGSEGAATNETLALQDDGKLVVAATVLRNGGKATLAVARFEENGDPDPFFATGGTGVEYLEISGVRAHDVALDSLDRIVVAGSADQRLLIARFATNGRPDGMFGEFEDPVAQKARRGYRITQIGSLQDDEALALTIQPDDKPVVAGGEGPDPSSDLLLARYESDGDLDLSFSPANGAGYHLEDIPSGSAHAYAIDRHPDGKLSVAGDLVTTGPAQRRALVARFTSNGARDGNPAAKQFGANQSRARAIEALAGDETVIAGDALDAADGQTKVLVARLRSDHATDASTLRRPAEGQARAEDMLLFNADHAAALAGSAVVSAVSNALAARYGDAVPDTDPPETSIGGAPLSGIHNPNPSFTFTADERASTFECRLDAAAFADCSSPHGFNGLTHGDHTFEVRATDDAGNTDPTPATHRWTIPPPPAGFQQRPMQFPGASNLGNVPGRFGEDINFPPTADFTMFYFGMAEGRPMRPGTPLYADATNSSDLDGEIVEYRWYTESDANEARNGLITRQTPEEFEIPYLTEGTRHLMLEVVDDEGGTGRMSVPLDVRRNQPPTLRNLGRFGRLNDHDGKFVVDATDPDHSGVRRLEWKVDGQDVGFSREGVNFLRFREMNTPITTGDHTIEVTAVDHENGRSTLSRRMTFTPTPVCPPTTMAAPRSTALKVTGCARQIDGNTAHGPVKVNGIVVDPNPTWDVTVTTGASTVIHSESAKVLVEGVEVFEGEVDWEVRRSRAVLPATSNLLGFETHPSKAVEGLGILGVVNDRVTLRRNAGASLTLELDLPPGFDGAGGGTLPLNTVAAGAAQAGDDELCFDAPTTAIGTLTIERLNVCTNLGTGDWRGDALVSLPDPSPVEDIELAVVFQDGGIDSLNGVANTNVALGPTPLMLRRLSFGIDTSPVAIRGGVRVVLPVLSVDALTGDVDLSLTFPRSAPFDFHARGRAYIFGFPFASADVHVRGLDLFEAEGRFGLRTDLARAEAYAFGTVLRNGNFDFGGGGRACVYVGGWECLGVDVLISSIAAAACLELGGWRPGFAYEWDDGLDVLHRACDIGDYRATRRAAQAASSGLTVPPGLPGVVFAVEGRDGAPRVRLNGPNGEFIEVPETMDGMRNDRFVVLPMPESKTTHFAVSSPPAGQWTIEELPGSTPVTRVRSAHGLQRPTVAARVRGRGHRRAIVYTASEQPGQELTFAERYDGGWNALGTVKKAKGRLRFRPGDGAAGSREIFAIVRQDGLMRDRIRVTSYRAPRPLMPGRARRLRARHRGTRVRVTWKRARRAARYRVAVRLSDGRRRMWFVRGKRRSLVIRGVARRVRGTVRVTALRRDMRGRRTARAPIRRAR